MFEDSKEEENERIKEKRSLKMTCREGPEIGTEWTGLNEGNTESGVEYETGSTGVKNIKDVFEKKEQQEI